MNEFWDRLGISTSILCILHCLLTPLLIVLMPLTGEMFAHGWFHWVIVALVIPVAVWALWNGYRLHKQKRVLYLGAIGLTLVCLALYFGETNLNAEIALMVTGGILLASAHYANLRQCKLEHQ